MATAIDNAQSRSLAASDRDPRLPKPGSLLAKHYKGRDITVLVLVDGFEFKGEFYRTLTAVASKISGSHINGFQFFGLGKRKPR